jgi:homoserine dehydrogenase
MDGTPIFNLVGETLHGCKILSIKGILNSTTNFILTEMEAGSSLDDAVIEAQRRGFAEADPSMDLDGWDAAAKTSAIANVILNCTLKPTDIERTGIRAISAEDINKAKEDGKKIKLICEAFIKNDKIVGRVHPVLIPSTEIYSTIDATSSILSITTDLMGEVSIIEKNPEIAQTAYGIYSDLLTLIKRLDGKS